MKDPTMRSYALPAIAVSLLAATSSWALAADLPSRRAPPVYIPPPIPVFTWTGFFVGGNAGAAFDQRRDTSFFFPAGSIAGSTGTAGTLTPGGNSNKVSFAGGGQIGYNYEFGNGIGGFGGGPGGGIVIGAVADAQYLGNNGGNGTNYTFAPVSPLTAGNAFVPVAGLPATNLVATRQNENFFGTVRGRLGFAFERVMVYGTGGFAYNTRATGYTFGGGLEYALTNNISVGAEYLYVNINRGSSYSAVYVPNAGLGAGTLFLNTQGGRDTFNVARATLNYKFDFFAPIAPVVARY